MQTVRQRLRERRERHQRHLQREAHLLAADAAALGVQRVALFGSAAWGEPGLASDLDLRVVWDSPLDFLARTVALYRLLQPRVTADLLVYTPYELEAMMERPFVRRAVRQGRVLYAA
jgi:predicted nucleotidyltransferase